jgi:ubiquinone/menaquinone biosynthesis C-methylase UbiE
MFQDESYARQAALFDVDLVDPERQRIAKTWFDTTTADAWRHLRCYEIADYIGRSPGERWLTVGDGRYGLDSIRLKERGAASVLPTDIGEALLKEAKQRGLIEDYAVENAEKLSFANDSFDYVFCKEAYHHFPRPMLALYEMIRVARVGVILCEPHDRSRSIANRILSVARRRPHPDSEAYEDAGNFAYTISEREIEKVALGLNYPQVAFKYRGDHYVKGIEFEPADWRRSAAFRRTLGMIALTDFLSRFGIVSPATLMAAIFKKPLPASTAHTMRRNGWRIMDLPRNPYITDKSEPASGK